MSTAGAKSRTQTPRPRHSTDSAYVGQTFRKIQLTAGWRPFAVVSVDTAACWASGWVMVDPQADGEDPLLKQQGIQAADRKRPCYITVPTDMLK